MASSTELISDASIERAFKGTTFGPGLAKRDRIRNGLLQIATGYHPGAATMAILAALGLLTPADKLSKKGKTYLWEAFRIRETI